MNQKQESDDYFAGMWGPGVPNPFEEEKKETLDARYAYRDDKCGACLKMPNECECDDYVPMSWLFKRVDQDDVDGWFGE